VKKKAHIRLSVNLNKVALLRNARHTGVPNVLDFADIALEAGSAGITLHPRPDERHVRASDVTSIANRMRPQRPHKELNIEGYPDSKWLSLVSKVKPEQCTLVP
jgi:pyridoxine 5-phosphate synthase